MFEVRLSLSEVGGSVTQLESEVVFRTPSKEEARVVYLAMRDTPVQKYLGAPVDPTKLETLVDLYTARLLEMMDYKYVLPLRDARHVGDLIEKACESLGKAAEHLHKVRQD